MKVTRKSAHGAACNACGGRRQVQFPATPDPIFSVVPDYRDETEFSLCPKCLTSLWNLLDTMLRVPTLTSVEEDVYHGGPDDD